MDAVTAEAMAPPLRFPWTRVWPLAAAFPALFVWMAFQSFEPQISAGGPDLYGWFEMLVPMATEWVAGGLLTTLAVTAWSLRRVRLG
jgi:hypothetical protein